ncbi:helix-turn-helix transcriptional regulator [Macrococcus armenti]|uniref:helix-turn-helix transcriptional regulator n=1 Tax=Macrococcus armenti TaxID=2875764 RepID=UPI001CCBAB35|nr:helix-turn-helix transcriptional regulator [Macrococcus armenti]UBH22088.1 helix-turn-helix transcriptional regulator [Macrococcus armenti]
MSVKFRTYIKKYRLMNEMTQEELAARVNVRRETIMRLENAKYNPSLELAMRIAFVLKASIYDLFEFNFEGDD